MKSMARVLLVVSCFFAVIANNPAFSDNSQKGLYLADIVMNSGSTITGYVAIVDSGRKLDIEIYKYENIKYQFGKEIIVFKDGVIEMDHPSKYFLKSDNKDFYANEDIKSKFFVADESQVTRVPLDSVSDLKIVMPVTKQPIDTRLWDQMEVVLVSGNDKILLLEKEPLCFMVFETDINRRVYVFSYGNNGIALRSELYSYLFDSDSTFDPKLYTVPRVLSEGVYVIPVEYETESL